MANYYIPSREAAFDTWFSNLVEYVLARVMAGTPVWKHSGCGGAAPCLHGLAYVPTLKPHTAVDTEAKKAPQKVIHLLLMAGTLFELAHFYGLDDQCRITALVTTAKPHVRAVWPEPWVVNIAETRAGETVETEFSCINYATDVERRFCGKLAL